MKLFNAIFATVTAGLIATTLALTAASFAPHAHPQAEQVAMVASSTSNG